MPSEIRVNFSDAKLVPEDMYLVKVDEVTLREAKNGSEYLRFDLSIVDGDHMDSALTLIGSLREEMYWLLRLNLRALGIDANDLVIKTEEGDAGDEVVVRPDLVGKEALVT